MFILISYLGVLRVFRQELITVMYTQNKFLFCGIHNHYTKQKQVPSEVWSVWDVWGEWDVWSVRM